MKESQESFLIILELSSFQTEIFKINKLVDRHVLTPPLVLQIPKAPHS
jgi:hypothetical protein